MWVGLSLLLVGLAGVQLLPTNILPEDLDFNHLRSIRAPQDDIPDELKPHKPDQPVYEVRVERSADGIFDGALEARSPQEEGPPEHGLREARSPQEEGPPEKSLRDSRSPQDEPPPEPTKAANRLMKPQDNGHEPPPPLPEGLGDIQTRKG